MLYRSLPSGMVCQQHFEVYGHKFRSLTPDNCFPAFSAIELDSSICEKPVILLDDVLSELDAYRQDYLINEIKGWQVFITCCEPYAINEMLSGKSFRLINGKIAEKKEKI